MESREPDLLPLQAYIAGMPAGKFVPEGWETGPFRVVVVSVTEEQRPFSEIADAFPPRFFDSESRAGSVLFVVPELAVDLLDWYSGEYTWFVEGATAAWPEEHVPALVDLAVAGLETASAYEADVTYLLASADEALSGFLNAPADCDVAFTDYVGLYSASRAWDATDGVLPVVRIGPALLAALSS